MSETVFFILLFFLIFQILFYVYFNILLGRYKLVPNRDQPPISVIVALKNEEKNVVQLINGLAMQQYREFEVILVNDHSEDSTLALINQTEKPKFFKVMNLGEVPTGWNSKKYALNEGIKKSRYQYLLFTDADCIPESDKWIASMSQNTSFSDIVLGVAPVRKRKGFLGLFIQYENFMTHLQMVSLSLAGMPYMGIGRNLLYNKGVFNKYNGFEGVESVTGGDDDLLINKWSNKEIISVNIEKEARVNTYGKETWRSFFRQKLRHLSVGKKYKLRHIAILGSFIASKCLFWLCVLYLLITGWEPYLVILSIVCLLMFVLPVTWDAKVKFNSKFNIQLLLFLDFVYGLYYITTSIAALFVKRIKWT